MSEVKPNGMKTLKHVGRHGEGSQINYLADINLNPVVRSPLKGKLSFLNEAMHTYIVKASSAPAPTQLAARYAKLILISCVFFSAWL